MSAVNAVGYGGISSVWRQAYHASNVSAARASAANPAQPETPVEPVSAVRKVAPDAAVRKPIALQEPQLPTEESLNNAADTLARMRIQYAGESPQIDGQTMAQTGLAMNAAGVTEEF